MTRLAVVTGTTRPGRKSRAVAEWVLQVGQRHEAVANGEMSLHLVDIADFALPLLDEPVPAAFGVSQHEHTQRWAATVAGSTASCSSPRSTTTPSRRR